MSTALRRLSKAQRSLLLFLETRAVDYGGKVDLQHMNSADMAQAREWHKKGFLRFGRICLDNNSRKCSHWVELTDKSWKLAHEERRARNERMDTARKWLRTEET